MIRSRIFLPDDHGDVAEQAAESERAVSPMKTWAGEQFHHRKPGTPRPWPRRARAARRSRDVRDEQVLGHRLPARDEGQDGQAEGDEALGARGEAVHAVGDVHGVGHARDHHHSQNHEDDLGQLEDGRIDGLQVADVGALEGRERMWADVLGHAGRVALVVDEPDRRAGPAELEDEFLPGVQALARAAGAGRGGELEPVVDRAQAGQPEQDHQAQDDVEVGDVGQQEGGPRMAAQMSSPPMVGTLALDWAAAARSAGISKAGVADLLAAQPADDGLAEENDGEKSERGGGEGAELELVEDPEHPGDAVIDEPVLRWTHKR